MIKISDQSGKSCCKLKEYKYFLIRRLNISFQVLNFHFKHKEKIFDQMRQTS